MLINLKKFNYMPLLAARHCLGGIYQVKCFLGGPFIFIPFACVVLFIFGSVPYSCEVEIFNVIVQFERCFRLMGHITVISCCNPINLYITEKLIKFSKSLFKFCVVISNK